VRPLASEYYKSKKVTLSFRHAAWEIHPVMELNVQHSPDE